MESQRVLRGAGGGGYSVVVKVKKIAIFYSKFIKFAVRLLFFCCWTRGAASILGQGCLCRFLLIGLVAGFAFLCVEGREGVRNWG